MSLENLREGAAQAWEHLAEGWRHLRQQAVSALTRFRAGERTNLPRGEEVDDLAWLPARGWAVLGGELFEDDRRIVVRLEIPGLDREHLRCEVRDGGLRVAGEKRFTREDTRGRWRVMQCAYGSFERVLPLPVAVDAAAARASYRAGVLRVELPKVTPGRPAGVRIEIE